MQFPLSNFHGALRWFCCAIIFSAAYPGITSASLPQETDERRYEVGKIRITIDGMTEEESLRGLLETEETPFRIWTYIYENIYEKLGLRASFFDPIIFSGDIIRLKLFLNDQGYLHAAIDTSIVFDTLSRRVNLSLEIKEAKRSLIDTVRILGIEKLDYPVLREVLDGAVLKQGDPYVKDNLEAERQRLTRIFQANGYSMSGVDSIAAVRYLSTDNFSITFGCHVGARYVFGPYDIEIDRGDVEESVIFRQLNFERGQIYNAAKKVESEQNLNALGLFENVTIETSSPVDTVEPPYIPLHIVLRARELQEVTPEFLIDNEYDALNAGLGLGYNHRNFFGDARFFSFRTRFRLQAIDNLDIARALASGFGEPSLLAKVDAQVQLTWPYVFSNRLSASSGVTAEYEKQRYYDLNTIRSRLGLTNKFEAYTLGFADWSLERVGVQIKDTAKIKSIAFTGTREAQFNSILAFTLQHDKTNDIFSPSSGFFHSGSIEEAGAIPRLLGRSGSTLPFAEYYKLSFLARYFFSGEAKNPVLALKLKGGFANLYRSENQTPVPPTRKFYAGGSGSVRGWKARSLASFDNPDEGGNVLIEGSIENRIHLFLKPNKLWFVNLESLWGVIFFDYGNLWNAVGDVSVNQLALAVGAGFRYETFVGPLRVDFGLRLYDPSESEGLQWIFARAMYFDSFTVHFGIGQAF